MTKHNRESIKIDETAYQGIENKAKNNKGSEMEVVKEIEKII